MTPAKIWVTDSTPHLPSTRRTRRQIVARNGSATQAARQAEREADSHAQLVGDEEVGDLLRAHGSVTAAV